VKPDPARLEVGRMETTTASPPAAAGGTSARPRALLAWVVGVTLAAAAVPIGVAVWLYWRANGPTVAGLALSSPLAFELLAITWLLRPRLRRGWALLVAALLLADAAWVVHRLWVTRPGDGVRFCANGRCPATPPLLARIPPEEETALAGAVLTRLQGLLSEVEEAEIATLLPRVYGSRRYPNLPNTLLLRSDRDTVRYLQWVPPGSHAPGSLPCLLFLHGYGGLLEPYLELLLGQGLGDEVVILAPALDNRGGWWEPRGVQVALELRTRYLPPEVDPGRVWLAGLSNGAVGATAIATDPALGPSFRGAILISGIGRSPAAPYPTPMLVIHGRDDPRFSLDGVRRQVATLGQRGVPVALRVLPGTHLVLLSNPRLVTAAIRAFVRAGGGT
jgi:hypothetical protein